MTDKAIELEPCPFCPDGGKPSHRVRTDWENNHKEIHSVACLVCYCQSRDLYSAAETFRLWNTRATLRDNQGCAVVTVEEVTFEMFENECSKYRGNMRVMADYLMNAYPNGLRIIPTPPEKGEG